MRKPAAALLLVALSLHTACSKSEDSGRGGLFENTPGRYLGTEPKGKYNLDELYSYPIKWGTAPSSVAWSPDGTRISFLWNAEDHSLALRDETFKDAMKRIARYFEDHLGIGPGRI